MLDTVIQRPQQVSARAVGDHVFDEAATVQVVGDEVIGRRDLASCQFRSQVLVACASCHDLAPGLRWQGECFRCGLVPLAALRHVVHAHLDFGRQRHIAPFLDGIIDIGVRVFAQQRPDWPIGTKGDLALLLGGIEEERKDSVFADVLGDVLFGIVGPHLLLVDILLEDVAEHIGVDLAVAAQRAIIQVPVELIEEREELLKRLVGDGDLRVRALQHMHIEQAAVEIGHVAQQRLEFWCMHTLTQPLMEELQQEIAVEGVELILSPFLLHETQPVGEIVGIAIEPARCFCVQEALALDEIDEHQAVEHERGIPLAISLRVNPTDEIQERSMFAFEAVIELLRDALDIESFCHAPGHLGHLQALFLFQS